MMIWQKVTFSPIFNAVKFKQLQDSLDPFAVEFILSFATYQRIGEFYTCSQRDFELLLCILRMLFESELLLTIVSALQSLRTAILCGLQKVSLYGDVPA